LRGPPQRSHAPARAYERGNKHVRIKHGSHAGAACGAPG
jgi:hypothetical protein